jgi:hemerythrin-like domain-containing protein
VNLNPSPVADLKHEHSYVGMVVVAMEREAAHVRAGGEVHLDAVRQMVEFTRELTDGCHHGKEEMALFPRLLEGSTARPGGCRLNRDAKSAYLADQMAKR